MNRPSTDLELWVQRIRASRTRVAATEAADHQVIRDAHAAGLPQRRIAAACGTTNRERVGRILSTTPETPTCPPLPTVVYLRGQACSEPTWTRLHQAMWARGWHTVTDYTDACHLARGGVHVVALDFSAAVAGGLENDEVTVSRVRARYNNHDLDLVFLAGEHPTRPRPMTLDPAARDGRGANVLDVDALARMIATTTEEAGSRDG